MVIAGSITQPLNSPTDNPVLVLTFGGSSITANSNSQFIIDGQTLTPGGTITVSGTPIQLGPDGSAAVFGTSTEPVLFLPPAATSTCSGCTIPSSTGSIFLPPTATSTCDPSSFGCGHGGVTASGITTIPSQTRHSGSRPTSGHGAFIALQPFAAAALGSFNAAIGAIEGLGGGGSGGGGAPSSQDFLSLGSSLGTAFSDLSSLGADLNGLLAPGGGLSSETLTINGAEELSIRVLAEPMPGFGDAIELVDVGPSPPEIAPIGETITETAPMIEADVEEATRQVGGLLQRLPICISNPSSCQALWAGGAAALAGAFGTGLVALGVAIQRGVQNLAGQDPNDTTSISCSSSRVVTDYWVSCTSSLSGSASCTTTSSSLATGCDVTATTTTTSAAACPAVTDDPYEDQGEDGDASEADLTANLHAFQISAYNPKAGAVNYLAFSWDGYGNCSSDSPGVQTGPQGWLVGATVSELTSADTYTLTPYSTGVTDIEPICGQATFLIMSRVDDSSYSKCIIRTFKRLLTFLQRSLTAME